MPWSKDQKRVAAVAARSAGLDDEARRLVLRQFPRAVHRGRVTSTSPRLNQSDFEQYMAILERSAGGRLDRWPPHHWQRKADDDRARMRRLVRSLEFGRQRDGALRTDAMTWARARIATVGDQDKRDLAQLDHHELSALINQLQAFSRATPVPGVSSPSANPQD
jgi:hypothetical protein